MKNLKFCFYFCLQYTISHTILFYVFGLSFLKIILEMLFIAFTVQSIPVIFYDFKSKWLPIPYSQTIPMFLFLAFVVSNLCHIHHQCLSQCKLNLMHVASTCNIQKIDQKQLETRKQDGSSSVPSKGTIQVLKEKEIEVINKNVRRKRKERI